MSSLVFSSSDVNPLLECCVCLNDFDITINKPMGLQCGHIFCKTCLSKLQQARCPKCRASFEFANVQPSILVMNFLEMKNNAVKYNEAVGTCETNKPHPMTFCFNCEVFYFSV